MKNITNSLAPLASLVLLGTCLVSVFGFLVVLVTSVGFGDGLPLLYYQRLYVPVISVALPVVGMILFAVILLGFSGDPAKATKPTSIKGAIDPNEEWKKKDQRLKAIA